MRTPTDIISVTDGSGNPLKHRITRKGNVINIRIGDPKKFVTGMQIYEIFYKVKNTILFFDDHDELYWNVTGNYWNAQIRKARCTVTLSSEKSNEFRASCYTGRTGSTETSCKYTVSDNFIEFVSERLLSAGEGLTIAYGWNKGIIQLPSSFNKIIWTVNFKQNWVFILPVISFSVMLYLWHSRGRDPRVRESIAVMYRPPEYNNMPLSPAEVGAMADETLDTRDITATIVGLAVKGFIRIEETEEEGLIFKTKDYYLAKVKEPDGSLSLFEKTLMSYIFGSLPRKMVSELKNTFYIHIRPLKKLLYNELIRKKYFLVNPENVRIAYSLGGFIVIISFFFMLTVFFVGSIGPGRIFVSALLTGLPILGFSKAMPAKTGAGIAVYEHILGFEEFLGRAEKGRLERMKDENLFSKYFPYALSLNVADNWANAFEGIYQQPPQWYVSRGGFRTFNPVSFNHSINSAMSSLSSAMFSAPRSSGVSKGEGGFSGGGFGGGGGGSW